MKKVIFGLIATVFMSVNANAQWTRVITILTSLPPIEIETGTKSFVNNQVVCLGGGICSIKIGVKSQSQTRLGLNNEGNLFLVINEKDIHESLKKDFVLKEDVTIDNESLQRINEEIRNTNPQALYFEGLKKGYTLRPLYEEGKYYFKLN